MCRLFGLHAGRNVVTASFWLLDAADSLAAQSKRNPDGAGIGVFEATGEPVLDKQPIAAWKDAQFAAEAKSLVGTTFLAHVRYATTGNLDVRNTHPFLQDGRLFAHNGVVEGMDTLDARLAQLGVAGLVAGQTDSERVFALVTAAIKARGGDVGAGLTDAVKWLAANVPVFALNVLLADATDMWALRYPDAHELYVLNRDRGLTAFEMQTHRIRASSGQLNKRPSVVFASEPMDDDPGWQLLDPGVLVHVDASLTVRKSMVLPDPPSHQLTLADLSGRAAAAQGAETR
ncbi:MAG: class II glutamine amidotransferase [Actinomycetia bacterium]|nr:class II glutamine amidotransferase [Actinomycetes bacterium]MCH9768314.1 class II glutamine amidotransferase [Actinomycetes bacterium]